jgi:hypothetical protein
MWRGGLGAAYLLPALSSAGASLASPLPRGVTHGLQPSAGRVAKCLSCFSYVIYFSQCDEMKAAVSRGIPFL